MKESLWQTHQCHNSFVNWKDFGLGGHTVLLYFVMLKAKRTGVSKQYTHTHTQTHAHTHTHTHTHTSIHTHAHTHAHAHTHTHIHTQIP